jgi:hypothetical protein
VLVSGDGASRGIPSAPHPSSSRDSGGGGPTDPSVPGEGGGTGGSREHPAGASQGLRPRAPSPANGSGPRTFPGTSLPPERSLAPPELPLRIRVTAFASLLADPYLWLLGQRVGGASPDRRLGGRRGEGDGGHGVRSLAHRVLEKLGRELREEKDAGRLAEVWRRPSGRRAAPVRRPSPPGGADPAFPARPPLGALARVEAAHRAEGWEVVAVETGTPPEGVPFPVDTDSVRLTGRVDRVDRHPEEGWLSWTTRPRRWPGAPDQTHRTGKGAASGVGGPPAPPLPSRGASPGGAGREPSPGGDAGGGGRVRPSTWGTTTSPGPWRRWGSSWRSGRGGAGGGRRTGPGGAPAPPPGGARDLRPRPPARARVSDDLGPLLGVGILAPPVTRGWWGWGGGMTDG